VLVRRSAQAAIDAAAVYAPKVLVRVLELPGKPVVRDAARAIKNMLEALTATSKAAILDSRVALLCTSGQRALALIVEHFRHHRREISGAAASVI
jgi:hypothetical protein